MRSKIALVTYLVATAGVATASVKRRPASYEDSFTRPKETGTIVDNYVLHDVSPAVTDAPAVPQYGLMERQNTFGRGPDTCAFLPDGKFSPDMRSYTMTYLFKRVPTPMLQPRCDLYIRVTVCWMLLAVGKLFK